MSPRQEAADDLLLVETLRSLPEWPQRARACPEVVLARAERHGLAGVLLDAARAAAIPLARALEERLAMREAARELDHAAHLSLLAELDDALTRAGVPAVALKGPLLAERLYPRPSARATSDVDLLVAEERVDDALRALATVGYTWAPSEAEERFRREHHHLHLSRESALPLELHFHAYRGLGTILPSAPLLERRRPALEFRSLAVLAPADELVYLAVHAAAHRFVRLGWLWDIRLLVQHMTADEIATAAARARELGCARVMSAVRERLAPFVDRTLEPLGRLDPVRRAVVRRVASEPRRPLLRSATRFVFSVALCDSTQQAGTYAVSAIRSRWSR